MGSEIELDVSGLEPPEPLERTLDALGTLAPGDTLRLHIHREPYPLYGLLRDMGYVWEVRAGTRSLFEILIRRADEQV